MINFPVLDSNEGGDFAKVDDFIIDGTGGWSNGHQVVPAPNDEDYLRLNWDEGGIILKQVRLHPGFEYHKIVINEPENYNVPPVITHESCVLSTNSFITQKHWEELYVLEYGWYDPKTDGVKYINYDAPSFYLSYTHTCSFEDYGFNLDFNFFVKLDSTNNMFSQCNLSDIITSATFSYHYYRLKNNGKYAIFTGGITENISNNIYEYDEVDSSKYNGISIIDMLIAVDDYATNEIYNSGCLNPHDLKNYITFNNSLYTYLENGYFECCGFIDIRPTDDSFALSDTDIPHGFYENENRIYRARFNSFNEFNSYLNISIYSENINLLSYIDVTNFIYDGYFSQYDINNAVIEEKIETAASSSIITLENISRGIVKYKNYQGQYNYNHLNNNISRNTLIYDLKNLNNEHYDDDDIIFGSYAPCVSTNNGRILIKLSEKNFKVLNAQLKIKNNNI